MSTMNIHQIIFDNEGKKEFYNFPLNTPHLRWSGKKSLFQVALLLLTLLGLIFPTTSTNAQESSPFYWEFINVEIDVQENGDMLITETQKYVFAASHTNERYRWLPLDKADGIDKVQVYEQGKLLEAKTGIENNQQWIRWQQILKNAYIVTQVGNTVNTVFPTRRKKKAASVGS